MNELEKISIADTHEAVLSTHNELERYRRVLPKPEELLAYIKMFTGHTIPYKRMCTGMKDSNGKVKNHNAPAEYVMSSMYGTEWTIVVANRSGGKTANAGIITGLEAYHMGLDVRILGGSGEQSTRMYEEFVAFLDAGFQDKLAMASLMSKTTFQDGNKVQMLVQSQFSVRGPHVPRLRLDEVEEFSPTIYDAAMSIAQSRGGAKSKVEVLSTRHKPDGLMGKLWGSWPSKKFIWCIWEVMEACTADRSCSRCVLNGECPGKEKMSSAVGYYLIDDIIDKKTHVSDDGWKAEWLCEEPRVQGMVYPTWGSANMKDSIPYDPNLPLLRWIDAGTTDPTVVLYVQPKSVQVSAKPATQYRLIMEKRWLDAAPSRMATEMIAFEKTRNWTPGPAIVDPAAAWFKKELEAKGIQVSNTNNDRDAGIATFRNLIETKTDSTEEMENGESLFIADKNNCDRFCIEMSGYHMVDGKIIEKKDHGPDAGRYGIMGGSGNKEYIRLI